MDVSFPLPERVKKKPRKEQGTRIEVLIFKNLGTAASQLRLQFCQQTESKAIQ
jgi:hypothetical protein